MSGCKRFHDVHPIIRFTENLTLQILKALGLEEIRSVNKISDPLSVVQDDLTFMSGVS
jgi:hypothetical protein